MNEVRTRFAPSPTGYLHIGGLRTALYSYAFTKSQNGKFILRIEDTDRNRFIEDATEKIYETLKKFNLMWDEGPFVQSERAKTGIYKKCAETLVAEGKAFYCQCPPRNAKEEGYSEILRDPCRDKHLSEGAIKLRVPDNVKLSFKDFVLDKVVEWLSDTVSDTTLLKSKEEGELPTYHLAAIVDDHAMKISHILRGHDWMPSTPVHLLVYQYLGFDVPEIGHLTDILDPDGGKLSKRKGSVSCEEMFEEGYLPEAILNFIMLLGWAPKDNREIFSLAEFVEVFDSKGFQKSNPVFNRKKLDWFNGYYIRQKSDSELVELLKPFIPLSFQTAEGGSGIYTNTLAKVVPLVKDRISKLSDFPNLAGFLFTRPTVDTSLFGDLPYKEYLAKAFEVLEKVEPWDNDTIQNDLTALIAQNNWKTGDFYMVFRIALSGSKFTPPITNCAEIIGKEETLLRLSRFSGL